MYSSFFYNQPNRFFRTDFDSLFANVFGAPQRSTKQASCACQAPAVNVTENDDRYSLEMEIPGIAAQDIDVQVKGVELTIRGERKAQTPEGFKPRWREIQTGAFVRTLKFPVELDAANVGAELSNGVLKLTLPKSPSAQPKKININVQ